MLEFWLLGVDAGEEGADAELEPGPAGIGWSVWLLALGIGLLVTA